MIPNDIFVGTLYTERLSLLYTLDGRLFQNTNEQLWKTRIDLAGVALLDARK